MVSVLLMCLLPYCDNHPNLFAADKLHASLYFGFLSRCQYLSSTSISSSNTAFAMQQGACNGIRLWLVVVVGGCLMHGWEDSFLYWCSGCCMGSCVESWGITSEICCIWLVPHTLGLRGVMMQQPDFALGLVLFEVKLTWQLVPWIMQQFSCCWYHVAVEILLRV